VLENNTQKILIFVSTGRCGTTRLAEILMAKLPTSEFSVQHQMSHSRLANISGNIMYYLGNFEMLKKIFFSRMIRRYAGKRSLICTDPLMSMVIPTPLIKSENVRIIHVYRDETQFSHSFFRFSRIKMMSFIAHNFVPFWQPGVYPIENILSKNIKEKYKKVARLKFNWFRKHYSSNEGYLEIEMSKLFSEKTLENLINEYFGTSIFISDSEFEKKSNQSS
jgi:hypothetical protein